MLKSTPAQAVFEEARLGSATQTSSQRNARLETLLCIIPVWDKNIASLSGSRSGSTSFRNECALGVQVTSHVCDVSGEAQVQRFRDELLEQHASDHVDLVFSNAGISGGGSFVKDSREEWERTFAINWWGVYYCARTFLPLLIASGDGVLVNISSVAGFWATAGSGAPITAYCTSEFAIKDFSESLIEDLRCNAPPVRVVVVMPGVVNTDIYVNSRRALGQPAWEQLSDAELLELLPDDTRAVLIAMGLRPKTSPPMTCAG